MAYTPKAGITSVLIVDDDEIVRDMVAAALTSAEISNHSVCSGEEALSYVHKAAINLILLDVSMPGISGIATLSALRCDAITAEIPVVMMTGNSEKKIVLQAAALGVRDFLLKSDAMIPQMLARINKYLPKGDAGTALGQTAGATVTAPALRAVHAVGDPAAGAKREDSVLPVPTFTAAKTLRRIERADIRPMPGGVLDLLSLSSSQRGSMTDIANCIKRDPVLASRLLRASNSAAFAINRKRISNVDDAVRHIGLEGVRRLVSSIGVIESFADPSSSRDQLRSWQHSIAMATIAERFAANGEDCRPELAYTAALCHDLAGILLTQIFPRQCQFLADQRDQMQVTTPDAQTKLELGLFGLPFAELAPALLARLRLPPAVSGPILECARDGTSKAHTPLSKLGQILIIANRMAHALLVGPSIDASLAPFSLATLIEGVGAVLPAFDASIVRSETLTTASLLSGPTAAELLKATQPALPTLALRVRYVAGDSRGQLDPVLTMLQLTAQEVQVQLPGQPDGEPVDITVSQSDLKPLVTARSLHTRLKAALDSGKATHSDFGITGLPQAA